MTLYSDIGKFGSLPVYWLSFVSFGCIHSFQANDQPSWCISNSHLFGKRPVRISADALAVLTDCFRDFVRPVPSKSFTMH